MTVLIKGFGVAGYRSFGPELQRIGPFGKLNIIIGQNNSGKSNILRLIKDRYDSLDRLSNNSSWNLENHEYHNGLDKNFIFAPVIDVLNINALDKMRTENPAQYAKVQQALENGVFPLHDGLFFVPYQRTDKGPEIQKEFVPLLEPKTAEAIQVLNQIHVSLFQQGMPQNRPLGVSHILNDMMQNRKRNVFDVHLVPAIREIKTGSYVDTDFSGNGLIQKLHQLKNPAREQWSDKNKFDQITSFLRTVISNPSANIEIPHSQNEIVVEMDGKVLPLESLGTGIHEVIILAAAATIIDNEVVCLEEPEIHLHPRLQKQLLRYLQTNTNNQYFITTHSAHLMDTPEASIFHVEQVDGCSVVESISSDSRKSYICSDLGYRPSDLLQANCIIWVEGPSDRIYLNHWIKSLNDQFIEGQHYSIMFYGGRLLSHLTADDDDISSFIALQKLNRHCVIMIDSDRSKGGAQLNKTKLRIQKEFDHGPGHAWITDAREIENYIGDADLESAVKAVHKNAVSLKKTGHYEHNLHYVRKDKKTETSVDKVKVAHKVCEQPANFDILDLRSQMNKLIRFIASSNAIDQ